MPAINFVAENVSRMPGPYPAPQGARFYSFRKGTLCTISVDSEAPRLSSQIGGSPPKLSILHEVSIRDSCTTDGEESPPITPCKSFLTFFKRRRLRAGSASDCPRADAAGSEGAVGAGAGVQAFVGNTEPLDRSAGDQVFGDNLLDVGRPDVSVPDGFRIDHYDRAMLALI